MTATTQSSSLDSCIQACLECLKDCENCATACLESDMVQMMAECIKRCRESQSISDVDPRTRMSLGSKNSQAT